MVGQVVGNWRLISKCGEGGSGEVWRAEHQQLAGRFGALKLFHRSRDPATVARATTEARNLARLSHPNLAEVWDVGQSEGGTPLGERLYIVTRFIEGRSLEEEIYAERKLPVERAVAIVLGLARALEAVHDAGLIHRDIKPSNVLLPAGAPPSAAVLVDLNLAGHILPDTATTMGGQIFGTPAYMSPEQIRGQPQDRRSDVWGLGAMLYEMVFGQLPFAGNAITETLAAALHNPVVVPPDAPPGLRSVIERALAKAPDQRFSTMTEMIAALEGQAAPFVRHTGAQAFATEGHAAVTRPTMPVAPSGGTSPSLPVGPPPKSSPRAFVLQAATATVLLAGAAIALHHLLPPGTWRWALAAAAALAAGALTLWLLRRRARAAPQVMSSLVQAKQQSDRRKLVTESLAITLEDLFERTKALPHLQLMTASVAFEFEQYVDSKASGDRGQALVNALRLIDHLEQRLAKKSWLERYDKVVASVAAGVALFASVAAQRKQLFASEEPPRLAIEGCPTAPVPPGQRLVLSPYWVHAPAKAPERFAWFVDGDGVPGDSALSWTAPGAPGAHEITLMAPGYPRARCTVTIKN